MESIPYSLFLAALCTESDIDVGVLKVNEKDAFSGLRTRPQMTRRVNRYKSKKMIGGGYPVRRSRRELLQPIIRPRCPAILFSEVTGTRYCN